MRILFSGSTGFLGIILSETLQSQGARIIELGCKDQVTKVDLRTPISLPDDLQIDIVVHAAGKAHSVPKTAKQRQVFYEVNLEGTKNLCLALENLNKLPPSFIFISTVAVYGLEEGESINESYPLNGTTSYADSKVLTEEWLQKWAADNNVILSILRLPLVAGPNPRGNLGAMINGIKSGRYLSIGRGNSRKSIVWAEDVAHIIPTLAEKGGTYNLTDGVHPTFGELENAIADALNKKKPLKVPYWLAKGLALAGDTVGDRFPINSDKLRKITSTLTFDDSKARKELGWNPTPVLDKIREII